MIFKNFPELPIWAKKITIALVVRLTVLSLMFIEYLLELPKVLGLQQVIDSFTVIYIALLGVIFCLLFIDILTVIFVLKQKNMSKYLGIISSIILIIITSIFFIQWVKDFLQFGFGFHQDQVFSLVLLIASIFILITFFRNKFKPILSNKLGEPEFINKDNTPI